MQRVDTEGLDYIFYPVDGTEFVVNAEEDPGVIYDEEELVVDDWSVIVTLADVSSPSRSLLMAGGGMIRIRAK